MAAYDTVVFGGRDASGNYLSDLWLLRAYNATLTGSNQQWSGYGSGTLTTGVSANGQGVTVQYLTQCAAAIKSPTKTSSSGPSSTAGSGAEGSGSPDNTAPPTSSNTVVYDTSTVHKATAAISVALFFPALVLYRLSSPTVVSPHQTEGRLAFLYLGGILGVAAYGLGIAGLATAFTSITSTSTAIAKRTLSSVHLQTAHSKAAIALFAGMYGLVPILYVVALALRRRDGSKDAEPLVERPRADSTLEKFSMNGRAVSPSQRSEPLSQDAPNGNARKRVRSWAGIGTWAGITGRRSHETTSDDPTHTPSSRSFEVTNRPIRQRRASANSLAAFSDPRPTHTPRNLSDMSWLDTRRSASGMVRSFSGDRHALRLTATARAILATTSARWIAEASHGRQAQRLWRLRARTAS